MIEYWERARKRDESLRVGALARVRAVIDVTDEQFDELTGIFDDYHDERYW